MRYPESQISGPTVRLNIPIIDLELRGWILIANKRLKGVPLLGAFHGSDILNSYGGGDLADYLINFTATLDPAGGNASDSWPKWTSGSPNMLSLNDIGKTIIQDTYRQEAMDKVNEVLLMYPV